MKGRKGEETADAVSMQTLENDAMTVNTDSSNDAMNRTVNNDAAIVKEVA